jgi:hypothetical protein
MRRIVSEKWVSSSPERKLPIKVCVTVKGPGRMSSGRICEAIHHKTTRQMIPKILRAMKRPRCDTIEPNQRFAPAPMPRPAILEWVALIVISEWWGSFDDMASGCRGR